MELETCVPPGFRFHPTEEELVGYYLARKVASQKIDIEVIQVVDLYRIEPWDLQDSCCKYGNEEQAEWYFFSYKDRKYPSGTRTNRATAAGFWKATGRDKPVLSKSKVIGMRKTLVFYKGRAPNGRKTDWIMHEYRLQSHEHGLIQEEGWVVCRAFRKPIPNQRQSFNHYDHSHYYDHFDAQYGLESLVDITRPTHSMESYPGGHFQEQPAGCGRELESKNTLLSHAVGLPQLDSPKFSTSLSTKECFERNATGDEEHAAAKRNDVCEGQLIDWKVLDKLLSSPLNESASSSMPIVSVNYDAGDQSQLGDHFLALFDSS